MKLTKTSSGKRSLLQGRLLATTGGFSLATLLSTSGKVWAGSSGPIDSITTSPDIWPAYNATVAVTSATAGGTAYANILAPTSIPSTTP